MNRSEFEQEQVPSYKIIIVGKSHSGKTKLLARYKFGSYQDSGVITIGVDSHIIRTSKAKFSFYDTAGQDIYKAIVDSYYRGSDACIIVYDVSSVKSFQQIAYYYDKVKELSPDCLIYIFGCKSDLQREVSQQLIQQKYKGITHQTTSAKNNYNVVPSFEKIQNQLLRLKIKQTSKIQRNRFNLSDIQKDANRKKGCC